MKARHEVPVRPRVGDIETVELYHDESSPNSSVIFSVTVLTDMEDVLAVIRTAALLGKNFQASTSVNLLGEDAIHIGPEENRSQASLAKLLDVIQGRLCKQGSSRAPVFALEANITAASFLAAGTIAVHIRHSDSVPKRPTFAR
jgi:hypothetical protein